MTGFFILFRKILELMDSTGSVMATILVFLGNL